MNAPRHHELILPWLQRRYVECLTLLALLFVLQASLVPFDFHTSAFGGGGREYFDSSVGRLILPDIISNIFLYVPLGMLGFWTLRRWGGARIISACLVTAIGAALSVLVEHVQYFSPSRVSSLIDVVSNIVGVTLGVALSFPCRLLVSRMVELIGREFRCRPHVAVVKSYVLVLILFASMPFAFSFDTNRLKESIKAVNLRPFATANWEDTTRDASTRPAAYTSRDYRRWTALKCWSRWVAEFATFGVFAWLVYSMCVQHYGFSRRAAFWLTWWFTIVLAIGLSLLHIPLMLRDLDITDVLFRWLGGGVGVVARSWMFDTQTGKTRPLNSTMSRRLRRAAITTAVLFITYNGVIPLTFQRPEGGVGADLSKTEFLPFMAYFVTRFDLMMTDVMEKFASYTVLAVLLAGCWRSVANQTLYRTALKVATVCVLLSCAIEAMQLFIPVRVVSLTDPILAAAGAVVGVVTHAKFMSFYRHVTSVAVPRAPGTAARGHGRLGPTDALIATLAEPREEAPREPSPPRQRLPRH